MSCVSILLTGAELAEFKSSANLQLFWSQEEEEAETGENILQEAVELRCKSGTSGEFSAVPFSAWSINRDWENRGGMENPGKLRLLEGFSASLSPIVLKSRAVLEEEKQMKWSQNLAPVLQSGKPASMQQGKKQRAFSMDETQLEQIEQILENRHRRSITRDDLLSTSSRRWIKPLPLPLPPPPPGDGDSPPKSGHLSSRSQRRHRRHLSIDLRASPSAKFLVQLMPWEIPRSPEREKSFGDPSFVPFKWEEAPGKPKSGVGGSITSGGSGFKLRLPPRLQQQSWSASKSKASTSPTSTLDQRIESSSSSSSSPTEERMKKKKNTVQPVKIKGRIRTLLACRGVEEVHELEEAKMNLWSGRNLVSGSWSPSPRLTWLQRSGLEVQERIARNGALGKLADGCNVVKRAMRSRWWVCRRKVGAKKQRKSMYRPLLCSVDGA